MPIRSLLLAFTVWALVPVVAAAQSVIDLYPAVGTGYVQSCNLMEGPSGGVCDVAVVVSYGPALLGVEFAVYQQEINWTPLAIVSDYATFGWFNDLAVGFGACLSPPIRAATLRYLCPGGSPCGQIRLGASQANLFEVVRCDLSHWTPSSDHLTINGVYDVPPGGQDPSCWCPTVPTQPSTWGRVKALYRD